MMCKYEERVGLGKSAFFSMRDSAVDLSVTFLKVAPLFIHSMMASRLKAITYNAVMLVNGTAIAGKIRHKVITMGVIKLINVDNLVYRKYRFCARHSMLLGVSSCKRFKVIPSALYQKLLLTKKSHAEITAVIGLTKENRAKMQEITPKKAVYL